MQMAVQLADDLLGTKVTTSSVLTSGQYVFKTKTSEEDFVQGPTHYGVSQETQNLR